VLIWAAAQSLIPNFSSTRVAQWEFLAQLES
jgi:hypothetical protein